MVIASLLDELKSYLTETFALVDQLTSRLWYEHIAQPT
jgi:hypothetical protein